MLQTLAPSAKKSDYLLLVVIFTNLFVIFNPKISVYKVTVLTSLNWSCNGSTDDTIEWFSRNKRQRHTAETASFPRKDDPRPRYFDLSIKWF